MMQAWMQLIEVPADAWQGKNEAATDLLPFMRDALAIERRMVKEVNIELEQSRYRLCCRRIQEAALRLTGGDVKTESLAPGYLAALKNLHDRSPLEAGRSRLAACFFPPDALCDQGVGHQLNTFDALASKAGFQDHPEVVKRLAFFRKTKERGAGVVEVLRFAEGSASAVDLPVQPQVHEAAQWLSDAICFDNRLAMAQLLAERIQAALAANEAVNFSNQPHFVIAEVLNTLVYQADATAQDRLLRVVYADGSEAEPFPLPCLKPLPLPDIELPVVKAALVSMRHLEMDQHVDFAWFRNSKVSVSKPFAQIDAYCTAETLALLQQINEPVEIHLYQTGLETAVVGFYRGLVQALLKRRRTPGAPMIKVIPWFFAVQDKRYQAGAPWC